MIEGIVLMKFSLQQLSDLEEIRTLKHRYFRCIDTANEVELGTLFTDDVTIDLRGGGYRAQLQGRQNMVDFIGSVFNSDIIALHQGHMPEIHFTGSDSAEGTWYLEDRFINPERATDTIGSAIYRDIYLRVGSEWKIAHSEYDRIFEVVSPIDPKMEITSHMLAQNGRKPEARIDVNRFLIWSE
jgi:hypothetical protein